jgi:hypothetical protein
MTTWTIDSLSSKTKFKKGHTSTAITKSGNMRFIGTAIDEETNNTNSMFTFDSLSRIISHVKELPLKESGYDEGDDWYGASWEDTYRLASKGWPEGARKASKMALSIANRTVEHSATSLGQHVGFDVVGAAYDPGAYMSGIPECWVSFEPQLDKRGIHIVVNVATSGGVSSSTFMRRGIAVSSLAIALHSQGHPVTIDVIDALKPNGGGYGSSSRNVKYETIGFRVVDAAVGSPLDVDRVVFSIAHTAIFRRVMSAAMNGFRGKTAGTTWGSSGVPFSHEKIPGYEEADLFLGAGHLDEVEGWSDGGEKWVMEAYLKQTKA